MEWNKYKELRDCFKSEWHFKRALRLIANSAMSLAGLKKSMRDEKIEEDINAGLNNRLIARQAGISVRQVQRIRKELLKSKGK